MKQKFTKQEKSWILYDWANSVYATNIMAAIFPIYFASVCKKSGINNVVMWSYGTAAATFTLAVLAPVLGAIGDYRGMKKKLFSVFWILGLSFTIFTAFVGSWKLLLLGYIFSYIGFLGSCLFYDSFLTDVTTANRMNKVSSWGYAMGYIGGSTIPFIISIFLLFTMGTDNPQAMRLVILLTSLWWGLFTIPMLLNVRQVYSSDYPPSKLIRSTFHNIGDTFKEILKNKGVFLFILAYFCYIDGVNTVINLSTSYGSTLGLSPMLMIIALLVTQIVAVPCCIIFGKIADRVGSIKMLRIAVAVYFAACILGFFMGFNVENSPGSKKAIDQSQIIFWVMAILIGTVQGGIQAISRSYFGQLVPPSRSSKYFGFYDIFGKFAAVIGPLFVGIFSSITGRNSFGVLSVLILFLSGYILLRKGHPHFIESEKAAKEELKGESDSNE